MVFVVNNIYRVEDRFEVPHTGPLIDLLQRRWPDGFPGAHSAVYANGQRLEVEDYDYDVSPSYTVVIMPCLPAGLDPATIYLLVQIAVMLLAVAFSFLTMPGPPKVKGNKQRVYSIGSGQNVPALGELIAEHFGKMWFYPDVASQPYSTFVGNEQYINQILLLGAGKYRLDDIKIGNTPLSLVPPDLVDYRVYGPADHKAQYGVIQSEFNVFEDVVSSVDVQGLSFAKNPTTSFAGYAKASWGLQGAEAVSGMVGGDTVTLWAWPSAANNQAVRTVTTTTDGKLGLTPGIAADNITYQAVRDDDGWRGWFAVCPVGKTTNRIDFDFSFPGGINWRTTDGDIRQSFVNIDIEVQGIDDAGVNVGPLITASPTYSGTTTDTLRVTYSIAVPAGRYKVRARKDGSDDPEGRSSTGCTWEGLKAYCINTPGQFAYGDVTLIAIKLRASAALSSSSDKISVLATRILPTCASDFLTEAPTTNVCDAFAKVVRDADPDGVDLPALKVLAARWNNTNGFNFRFEDSTTVYAALQTIGLSHRAKPQAYAKLLSLRPDDAKPFDQYLVTQEQMVGASYKCGITIGPTSGDIDGFRVEYQDPTGTTDLFAVWPSTAITPQDTALRGCTDKATALAQAQFLWARRGVLRRVVTFDTEFDSLPFAIGDRIAVVSNAIDKVATVRLIEARGTQWTVDGILDISTVKVRVRDQYGSPSELIDAGMSGNILTLASVPGFPVFGINSGQEPTTIHWARW